MLDLVGVLVFHLIWLLVRGMLGGNLLVHSLVERLVRIMRGIMK